MPYDFVLSDQGSVWLLRPQTEDAQDWIDEHIASDAQQFGRAIVIEPRYVDDIVDGIAVSGLTIEEG